MRIIKSLVAVSAVAATAAALAVAPALADPVNNSYKPVRANSWDVVGAGSATLAIIMAAATLVALRGLSRGVQEDTERAVPAAGAEAPSPDSGADLGRPGARPGTIQ